jgi:hypothetical protein
LQRMFARSWRRLELGGQSLIGWFLKSVPAVANTAETCR